MGVIPVFDPASGASGGASGGTSGGQSYADIPYETLDVTSDWTALVKDSWSITGASYDANGIGTYTVNANTGGAQFTLTGASFPIRYRQAYALDASGNKVLATTDNNYTLKFRISEYQTLPPFASYAFIGLTTDPTSTTQNDFSMMSAGARWAVGFGNTKRAALITLGGVVTVGGNNSRSFDGSLVFDGGLVNRQTLARGTTRKADGTFDNQGTRNGNKNRTSGQPLYVVFGCAMYNASTTCNDGDAFQLKVEYQGLIQQ